MSVPLQTMYLDPTDENARRPVGASQVTSVVRQIRATARPLLYPVALRARLVSPYFVRLSETGPDDR